MSDLVSKPAILPVFSDSVDFLTFCRQQLTLFVVPWHGRGRRFDPDQVHHIFKSLTNFPTNRNRSLLRKGRPFIMRASSWGRTYDRGPVLLAAAAKPAGLLAWLWQDSLSSENRGRVMYWWINSGYTGVPSYCRAVTYQEASESVPGRTPCTGRVQLRKIFRLCPYAKNQGPDEGAPRVPDAQSRQELIPKSASPIAFCQAVPQPRQCIPGASR